VEEESLFSTDTVNEVDAERDHAMPLEGCLGDSV
jgi:hypothetical protein